MTPEQFVNRYPRAYHMGEGGSWPGVRERGLRSTSSLLDLYEVEGEARALLERSRRPESVVISHSSLPDAVVRDNKPISDRRLAAAITDGTAVADWYQLLNGKVFFWANRKRLVGFLQASSYAGRPHIVIEIRTADLVTRYADRIWLTGMNTGTTKPFAHPRGRSTFKRIEDFAHKDKVVEIAVDGMVETITAITESVAVWQQGRQLHQVWPAL